MIALAAGLRRVVGKWRAWAFLLSGSLWLVTFVVSTLERLGDPSIEFWPIIYALIIVPISATLVALFVFYPPIGDARRLSRVGRGLAFAAGVVLLVDQGPTLFNLIQAGGSISELAVDFGPLFNSVVVLMIGSSLAFGIASLRTGVPSQGVGLVHVGLAYLAVVSFQFESAGFPGTMAVGLVATGYLLRTGHRPLRGIEPIRFQWASVRQWRGPVFALAGGVWLFTAVLSALPGSTVWSLLTGLLGMMLAFVGVLGFYPRLADQAPKLTLGGVVAGGIPFIANLGLFAILWVASVVDMADPGQGVIVNVLGASPERLLQMVLEPVGIGFVVLTFVLWPLGTAIFGAAMLLTDTYSRTLGYLLLLPIIAWIVGIGGSTAVFGDIPDWLAAIVFFIIGFGFVSVWYVDRLRSIGTMREAQGSGMDSDGWANERVRVGFEVDGSQSLIVPIGMGRRVRLAQAVYELLGETGRALNVGDRSLYPLIRRIGSVLGRERAVEQLIAEREYVLEQMTEIDRAGITSRRWWLGLVVFLATWLSLLSIGMLAAGALLMGSSRALSMILDIKRVTALGIVGGVMLVSSLGWLGWSLVLIHRDFKE